LLGKLVFAPEKLVFAPEKRKQYI